MRKVRRIPRKVTGIGTGKDTRINTSMCNRRDTGRNTHRGMERGTGKRTRRDAGSATELGIKMSTLRALGETL